MSIEAINEQLLRAIGVGVALIDISSLKLRYRNDTFVEWFGDKDETTLDSVFPDVDFSALRDALTQKGQHLAEASFKLRRRTMTVALEFTRALDDQDPIAVLVCQNISRIKELESMIDSYSMMVERNTHEIKREKEQVEKLLLNMMPRSAYEEYKTFGVVAPRVFDAISALTLDFENFEEIMSSNDPSVMVSELNDIFTAFDRIGDQFGCGRVRTTGDSYVTVSGVPDPVRDHAESIASAALRFVRYLERRNKSHPIKWNARIGIASGSVIGSVVGVQKYIYDVFGPAVSVAAECRSRAEPMTIVTDPSIGDLLDDRFSTEDSAQGDGLRLLAEADV